MSCPLPFRLAGRGGKALGFGIGTKGQDYIVQCLVSGTAMHEFITQEVNLGILVFKPRLELIDKITAWADPALSGWARL